MGILICKKCGKKFLLPDNAMAASQLKVNQMCRQCYNTKIDNDRFIAGLPFKAILIVLGVFFMLIGLYFD